MNRIGLIGAFIANFMWNSIAIAEGNQRQGKVATVAYEVIGFTLMPVGGFRAAYFATPDILAEIAYLNGSAKVGDFESKKSILELKGKYFLGSSFYLDGGLGHEMWTTTYPVRTTSNAFVTKNLKGSVTNTGLEMHIGNQWQWDGFTLGCDWVGYFLSLSTKYSLDSDSSVDSADKANEEESLKKSLGGSSAHLLRFYLGWSF